MIRFQILLKGSKVALRTGLDVLREAVRFEGRKKCWRLPMRRERFRKVPWAGNSKYRALKSTFICLNPFDSKSIDSTSRHESLIL